MDNSSNSFLGDLYTHLQYYDAEKLSLVHALTGAMLRDARTHLRKPPPDDPYLRSFKFSCGHVDHFFIFSLNPIRLAYFDETFRQAPCLSCLSWRLINLLDYALNWEPPKLKVDTVAQLPHAEIGRWQAILVFTEYVSDLPPEFRQAWQGLADDVLTLLDQTDGEFWLEEDQLPLHERILRVAVLGHGIFESRYKRSRKDKRAQRRALATALEFEDMTIAQMEEVVGVGSSLRTSSKMVSSDAN